MKKTYWFFLILLVTLTITCVSGCGGMQPVIPCGSIDCVYQPGIPGGNAVGDALATAQAGSQEVLQGQQWLLSPEEAQTQELLKRLEGLINVYIALDQAVNPPGGGEEAIERNIQRMDDPENQIFEQLLDVDAALRIATEGGLEQDLNVDPEVYLEVESYVGQLDVNSSFLDDVNTFVDEIESGDFVSDPAVGQLGPSFEERYQKLFGWSTDQVQQWIWGED